MLAIMPNPDRTVIRRRLALGAVAGIAVLALGLGARDWLDNDGPETPTAPVPAPLDVETRPLPLPAPPMSLSALAAAAGQSPASLVGRRFLVRVPFGCEEAAPGPLTATFDAAERTLRLRAQPHVWTAQALSLAQGQADAVEGFWAPAGEDCAAGASDETLGLAMVYEPGGSRLQRRGGRAYEFVGKLPEGAGPSAQGYRLLLAGEVSDVFGGEPVRCHKRQDGVAVCLIAVVFDQVAFEDPVTRETLAEWRMN